MSTPVGVQPQFYTTHEGGSWWPWTHGIVTEEHLAKTDRKFVEVNNQPVHSFLFGPLDEDSKRWDCANGWTHE